MLVLTVHNVVKILYYKLFIEVMMPTHQLLTAETERVWLLLIFLEFCKKKYIYSLVPVASSQLTHSRKTCIGYILEEFDLNKMIIYCTYCYLYASDRKYRQL